MNTATRPIPISARNRISGFVRSAGPIETQLTSLPHIAEKFSEAVSSFTAVEGMLMEILMAMANDQSHHTPLTDVKRQSLIALNSYLTGLLAFVHTATLNKNRRFEAMRTHVDDGRFNYEINMRIEYVLRKADPKYALQVNSHGMAQAG